MDIFLKIRTFTQGLLRKIKTQLLNQFSRASLQVYQFNTVFLNLKTQYATTGLVIFIAILFISNLYFLPNLQMQLEAYGFPQNTFVDFKTVLLALGSALIGAAAITFALVMFAMQVNVERLPYGLFHKFSSDGKLLAAFGGTFFLAISITLTSLIPTKSWISIAIMISSWGTLAILILFLYAYKRALVLISPIKQLSIVVKNTKHSFSKWKKRAERARPLIEAQSPAIESEDPLQSNHDLAKMTFFKLNPHWTNEAIRGMQYSIAFSRKYSELGDYEVSESALNAVLRISSLYVLTKGKTFFGNHLGFDNPQTSDIFINNTLEHIRQNIRIAASRGDEQQIEQNFRVLAGLVKVYLGIDYSNLAASKSHPHLAASYLSEGISSIIPHTLPDVTMEGCRLLGHSAQLFLDKAQPNDISTIVGELGKFGCTGSANEKFRPVTLVCVQELAKLTLGLLQKTDEDIRYAVGVLRRNIAWIGELFLEIPDTPLASVHSTYLGPYFSTNSFDSLLPSLTTLINYLAQANPDDKNVTKVISNFEIWADSIFEPQKKLLLKSVEKKSHFTFDLIHWTKHISVLLMALSASPNCSDDKKSKLKNHASWLISIFSFVPDNKENAIFLESLQMTEALFEVALEGHYRGCWDVSKDVQKLLLNWAFKAEAHQTGWQILLRSILGLAALALLAESDTAPEEFKEAVSSQLALEPSLSQDILETVANDIRTKIETLHRKHYSSSKIEAIMKKVEFEELKTLLEAVTNILSPN